MEIYRAAVIGTSRMGAFIDNEVAGNPNVIVPYSHAAGFHASPRTTLIACSDIRVSTMEQFGLKYNVPTSNQYTDYKEMIITERPDIVSIATQPEQRSEIIVFAANNGVKAIYAEKALAASMAEADAITDAVEANGVFFNMGTNRRWDPRFIKMRNIITSGKLGNLRSIVVYANGTLFNTASHNFDVMFLLNGDSPASWVMASIPEDKTLINGLDLTDDPLGEGIIRFSNNVTGYALLSPRATEWQAICDNGTITALNHAAQLEIRTASSGSTASRPQWDERILVEYQPASSTANLIEDLVTSLDTGNPTQGGIQIAKANTELIFAFITSHLNDGAKTNLPLGSCKLRLNRASKPKEPKFDN